jgi:hypothetical protein
MDVEDQWGINVRNMLYSQLRSPIQEIKHKQTTRIDRVLAVTTVRWPIQSNNVDMQVDLM